MYSLRALLRTAAATAALTASTIYADVRLPKIFGDHMVLQQSTDATVWGWAEKGEKVTVTLTGEKPATAEATAGDDGKWSVKIPTPAGGKTPLQLTVAGKNTVTLNDVLIGEVWVCSGQSNMEWPLSATEHPQEEILVASFPEIRLFTVAHKIAQTPQDDCEGQWVGCSRQTVPNFSAVAYYFGRNLFQELNVPVALIQTSWGGTVAEAWTTQETLAADEDFKPILERAANFVPDNPNQAAVLNNGMIRPIVPFAIRGAIWYQGESNVQRAAQYRKLFPAMIGDWRKSWGIGDFPFYFVQLAPFRYTNLDAQMCAELWEAQLKTLATPNTGMAVTVDIGNVTDIHPKNKQDVGRRLALWALAKTYGKDIVYSGPLYESMTVDGNKAYIKFQSTGGGLASRDGKPLTHFKIAGEDGQFVDATAEIDGATVVVSSDKVEKPAAVRFAWQDDAQPNLMNQEGLPASPFRTDESELLTANNK